MERTTNPVTVRIEWCRRQVAQARTEPEMDGWQAEENGLRDAVMNRDRTDDYRLCPPGILERYVLGFQDGTVLLRAARIERMIHAVRVPDPAPRMGWDSLRGDER
ncbi:MAG: hypothetical protein H8K04_00800 [Nitrospira sp.]